MQINTIRKEYFRARGIFDNFRRFPHLTKSLTYTRSTPPQDYNEKTMKEIVQTLTSFESNEEELNMPQIDDEQIVGATTAEYVTDMTISIPTQNFQEYTNY